MRCGVLAGSAVVFALLAGATRQTAAQVTEVATRGPRFLAISPNHDTPVDASDAPILRRRVSLSMTSVAIRAVLEEISRQAKVEFLYSDDLIRLDRKVSLEAKKLTVAAA